MGDMGDGLERLQLKPLTGNERFRGAGIESPPSLADFWRWSASCLMDNTARGLVAEFLVATALKGYICDRPRVEWDPYDFVVEIDGRRVSLEVKSSAYVQAWRQKRYSNLEFEIRPTVKWDPEAGTYSSKPCRADIYVFCALVEKNISEHAAALNTDNWRFRVVPKEELPDQETIRWSRLERPPIGYEHLRQRIEQVHRGASRTLAEALSDVQAACLEERYTMKVPERRDREVSLSDDS